MDRLYSKEVGEELDPNENVLVSVGAVGCLYCSFMTFLDPGDQIIVIEPYFDFYREQIQNTGELCFV